MLRPRATCCLLFAALCASAGGNAFAQQGRERGDRPPPMPALQIDRVDRDAARDATRARDSLSDSVRRVQRDTRGEVLSAERVPFDGREIHRVKVLDDRGRVRVYMDDPRRGGPRQRPRERTRDDDD